MSKDLIEEHAAHGRRWFGGADCRCPTCKENQNTIRELEREVIKKAGAIVDLTTQNIIKFSRRDVKKILIDHEHSGLPDYYANECKHPDHCSRMDLDKIIDGFLMRKAANAQRKDR